MELPGGGNDARHGGFTRLELVACVMAVIFLFALVVAPALAAGKTDAGRAICFNNLRLIGRAVQIWSGDHGRQFSWRTPAADGGGQWMPNRPPNAWFEYLVLSNELTTPKILACPSDTGVRTARTFESDSNGGFININYRQNALSYSLNLDGSPDLPGSWLAGDRNFQGQISGLPCSAGVNGAWAIDATLPVASSPVRWTNNVHGLSGHVLTTDGSVEYTDTTRLKGILLRQGPADAGLIHYLKAR